ncbi:MAG: sigma-70 family RNA polymerase sigma factor [Verrucomicrobiales bacterium]|nr:sigma-70 family RNA polymerase sigma factor [Verrucomicrobiales bacterium]
MNPTSDFVRLWTRHQAEVERYVFSMIPRQADAAVVLQDVSVFLWQKWDQFDSERPFVPWAIRFAYLEILKWRQKQAREKLIFSDSLLEQIHSRHDEEMPLMEARRSALTECLETLSGQQQKWVRLRYGRHGAVKQEAAESGISMHKIYYALEKIRDQLQDCIEQRLRKEGWSDA